MNASHNRASIEVAALATMTLAELREQWTRRYGEPPRHRASDLLRKVLAWRLQADVHGGLDTATRQMISRDCHEVKAAPTSGMRLAREWAGQRHEVIVTEPGILYRDQNFRSLSEVARHITGQRWNGPRFFGLREAKKR